MALTLIGCILCIKTANQFSNDGSKGGEDRPPVSVVNGRSYVFKGARQNKLSFFRPPPPAVSGSSRCYAIKNILMFMHIFLDLENSDTEKKLVFF